MSLPGPSGWRQQAPGVQHQLLQRLTPRVAVDHGVAEEEDRGPAGRDLLSDDVRHEVRLSRAGRPVQQQLAFVRKHHPAPVKKLAA